MALDWTEFSLCRKQMKSEASAHVNNMKTCQIQYPLPCERGVLQS